MQSRALVAALFLTNPILSGCSKEDSGDASSPGSGCVLGLCPPAEGAGIQMALDAQLVSGDEKRVCALFKIQEAGEFGRLEHRYTDISHHMVVYTTSLSDLLVKAFGFEEGK